MRPRYDGARNDGDADLQIGASGRCGFDVDDDHLTRRLIAAHFERLGCRPVEIQPERAATASAIGSAGPDDVLAQDIVLGRELDGFEVTRMLGNGAFGGRLIIVSGFGQEYLRILESLATALSIRVAGALAKPIRPAELERFLTG